MRTVRLAHSHLASESVPLLDRIRASTALSTPIDLDAGDDRSWFDDTVRGGVRPARRAHRDRPDRSPPVHRPEERRFFDGFVHEAAYSVATQLSHYDAHFDYQVDALPDELHRLDDRGEWDWLARLYLIEQYHHMVATGAVELQRVSATATGSTRSI